MIKVWAWILAQSTINFLDNFEFKKSMPIANPGYSSFLYLEVLGKVQKVGCNYKV